MIAMRSSGSRARLLTASAIGVGGRPGVFVRAGPPINNSMEVRIYCSGISAPEAAQGGGLGIAGTAHRSLPHGRHHASPTTLDGVPRCPCSPARFTERTRKLRLQPNKVA